MASAASPVRSFFVGNIQEDAFYPFPALSAEEQETVSMVIESIQRLMGDRSEEFPKYDRSGDLPGDFLDELRALGLFGIIIPAEYQGFGLSAKSYARIVNEVAAHDASTALTIGAHTSIGMRGLLLFGSDEQKARYLPRLASGEMLAAFCLTEPGAGSDAASVKTTARKESDGSYVLSGEKIWITNGSIASFFTVFARSGENELSAFLVERSFPGVGIGAKEDKMGIRASATTSVSFHDVRVPPENVLGKAGEGFKIAMTILNNGRTGLGGGCVGAMRRCIRLASEYAAQRKQFSRPIAEFELIQEKLAEMAVQAFASDAVVTLVSDYIDNRAADVSVEAAISKVYVTEALWNVANHALQIAGGNGFMREYPYEQLVRDARINMILEGTNEVLRLYIALSGLKDAGAYLQEVSDSLQGIFNAPIERINVLSNYVVRKAAALTSLGRQTLEFPHAALRPEAEIVERYVSRLGAAAEAVLRSHGKRIVERQCVLKRLADIAVDLFVGHAVLGRVSSLLASGGDPAALPEVRLARLFMAQAKRRMNQNIRRLSRNEDDDVREISRQLVARGTAYGDASFGR